MAEHSLRQIAVSTTHVTPASTPILTKEPPVPVVCATPAHPEAAVCPSCGCTMHLWAGFYRCRNCGYKESCCF